MYERNQYVFDHFEPELFASNKVYKSVSTNLDMVMLVGIRLKSWPVEMRKKRVPPSSSLAAVEQ